MKQYDRIVLLGIDGLDPRILAQLEQEGAVPNFARLRHEGSGGPLQTTAPAQSPVVWTSLATGTNPAKHGVFDFIHRDPERPLPFLSVCKSRGGGLLGATRYAKPRQNAAFWDILTERSVPVSVIRWPVTFPADKINGRMLAGLGVPGIRGTLGHYTFYTDKPARAPDVPPERLVKVDVNDGHIRTVVKGPMVRGLRGPSETTIPLTIQWTDEGLRIEVSGQSFELREQSWSDWIRLKIPVGSLKSISGIAKFYLVRRKPSFKLYMTALEADPARPALPIGQPPGYTSELAGAIGTYHTLGMPEDTKALNEHVLGPDVFAEQCDQITDERMRMFWHEFGRFEEGVLAFVFDTSDRIQHMFWRENEVEGGLRVRRLGPRIRDHYVLMDRFVGELLGKIGSDTALLVISDHGFASFDVNFDLNAWLVNEGLMTLTEDPRGRKDDETALYRLVDWPKTVAYGCGFSSLYVNLKGREGNGTVNPSEADALAARIVERLLAYKDPQTGLNVVPEPKRRQEIYDGPYLADAPDIVIGTQPGYRMSWQTAVGGVCADTLSPNEKHWCGDHIVAPSTVPGTILSSLPLDLTRAHVYDVAPTVLALLGLERPADCDGRVLEPPAET